MCRLVVDEMRIQQKLEYHKQRDAFVGDVDMSIDLKHLIRTSESGALASSLLCLLLCGLHARFKIPVAHFFTKGCAGGQLAARISHVVCKTEEEGFDAVRLVTNNHKVNVVAMNILCDGEARIQAPHPALFKTPLSCL